MAGDNSWAPALAARSSVSGLLGVAGAATPDSSVGIRAPPTAAVAVRRGLRGNP